jgi:transcriptional regulator with XRE-family HTH domain
MNKYAIPERIDDCTHQYGGVYSENMNIANRLDKAMTQAGFKSQSALSRASGIPQPTINRILKGGGKKGPETATIQKLAIATNVSFAWLHEGIDEDVKDKDTAAILSLLNKLKSEDRIFIMGKIEGWAEGRLEPDKPDQQKERSNLDRRNGTT